MDNGGDTDLHLFPVFNMFLPSLLAITPAG
jgi:hypothetical protein